MRGNGGMGVLQESRSVILSGRSGGSFKLDLFQLTVELNGLRRQLFGRRGAFFRVGAVGLRNLFNLSDSFGNLFDPLALLFGSNRNLLQVLRGDVGFFQNIGQLF